MQSKIRTDQKPQVTQSEVGENNRANALKIAEQKNFDVAILDDGLQQKTIKYDFIYFFPSLFVNK